MSNLNNINLEEKLYEDYKGDLEKPGGGWALGSQARTVKQIIYLTVKT